VVVKTQAEIVKRGKKEKKSSEEVRAGNPAPIWSTSPERRNVMQKKCKEIEQAQ